MPRAPFRSAIGSRQRAALVGEIGEVDENALRPICPYLLISRPVPPLEADWGRNGRNDFSPTSPTTPTRTQRRCRTPAEVLHARPARPPARLRPQPQQISQMRALSEWGHKNLDRGPGLGDRPGF